MGYRSYVVFAVNKKALGTNLEKTSNSNKELLESLVEMSDEVSENEDVYYFTIHSVKWYSDYRQVALVEDFVVNNPEECAFIRIGEEYEDIEYGGDVYEFGLQIDRSVTFPETQDCSKAFKLLFSEKGK